MKLICLNLWGGKLLEPLLAFITAHASDTDIFCFQEMLDTDTAPAPANESGACVDLYARVSRALPGFHGYLAPTKEGIVFQTAVDFSVRQGLALFVRENIPVTKVESVFVSGPSTGVGKFPYSLLRNIQFAEVVAEGRPLTIFNFHALLDDGNKRDTPVRLEQFRKVRDLLGGVGHAKIFCGDLNVYPDTESIRMFSEAGMKDLIKDFGVQTTRNDRYSGVKEYADYISDYAFTSPGVRVRSFTALPDEVSDHLALVLEFEL